MIVKSDDELDLDIIAHLGMEARAILVKPWLGLKKLTDENGSGVSIRTHQTVVSLPPCSQHIKMVYQKMQPRKHKVRLWCGRFVDLRRFKQTVSRLQLQ